MPYITDKEKESLAYFDNCMPETAGHLNYLITELCQNYLHIKGLSYTTINEIVGALTCAKDEFYRRVAVPYEDKKIKENGDVYK